MSELCTENLELSVESLELHSESPELGSKNPKLCRKLSEWKECHYGVVLCPLSLLLGVVRGLQG